MSSTDFFCGQALTCVDTLIVGWVGLPKCHDIWPSSYRLQLGVLAFMILGALMEPVLGRHQWDVSGDQIQHFPQVSSCHVSCKPGISNGLPSNSALSRLRMNQQCVSSNSPYYSNSSAYLLEPVETLHGLLFKPSYGSIFYSLLSS